MTRGYIRTNGEQYIIFGQYLTDAGMFLDRNGVVGFAPGMLFAGSPWVVVGPFLDIVLDDYLNDDHTYDVMEREYNNGLLSTQYESHYGTPTHPGYSSFSVFGQGGAALLSGYIFPLDEGVDLGNDEDFRRYLEQLQRQIQELGLANEGEEQGAE